ncbi:TraB/GumN family protein [Shewanella intestini]|uniref:TraB/GumN family protein n=1 Tax=Shewanella intestini TaxID=2017544 RepID=A0ABS5I0N8_9GAMM|nr:MULTISPECIES: TraB/GumN family protein [Shewanella]MBR9727583.1 TraB/GumN family protein [Shewanella intestini]
MFQWTCCLAQTRQLNHRLKKSTVALLSLATSLLISVGGSFPAFSATTDNPVFFQINYQGEQAYLLGSIHVGKDDFYPLNHTIEHAFSASDALVIEADMAKADVPALLQEYGKASPKVSEQTQQVLSDFCPKNAQLCTAIAPFAPWLQASQIGLVRFGQLGLRADKGVDLTFVANKGDKPLYQLESVAFQFKLLSSFSTQTQLDMVKEAIKVSDSEMKGLINAWRSGDEKQLSMLMDDPESMSAEVIEKLLLQRNHSMAAGIETLMMKHKGEQLFIVVGAGHLVGRQSVPSLLQSTGMTVKKCHQQQCGE